MLFALRSDLGRRRQNQEDAIGTVQNNQGLRLFVLCDGVGGSQSGEVASHAVVEYLTKVFVDNYFESADEVLHFLSDAIENSNRLLYDQAQTDEQLIGMSTTVVACVIFKNQLLVAHVGDSRLYISRVNELKQITIDHSYVQELLNLGGITKEEAKIHPNRNLIMRAVGSRETVKIDLTRVMLHHNDYILLCSDGLSDMVNDDDLFLQLNQYDTLDNITMNLVSLANQNGGIDNISTILIHYDENFVRKETD